MSAAQSYQSYLFVYGTLLSGDTGLGGRAQRDRLARESRVIAAATVYGRLYRLGRYPGLVLNGDQSDIVHGELLELCSPMATLAWLDDYEGIVPGDHPHNEYARRTLEVTRADGHHVMASGYVYQQPIAAKPLISNGRWLDRN
jgi:gamma-glutamylcyclotransferase (GGCT)/AIG2-like uncharacterized protein YtfP